MGKYVRASGPGGGSRRISRPSHVIAVAVATVGMLTALASPAYAYIDPGSGSLLWQLLVGVLLGAGVSLRVFWGRVRSIVRRDKRDRV